MVQELSGDFETTADIKQKCLLSPLLFALYLNDLHEYISGGTYLDELSIRGRGDA